MQNPRFSVCNSYATEKRYAIPTRAAGGQAPQTPPDPLDLFSLLLFSSLSSSFFFLLLLFPSSSTQHTEREEQWIYYPPLMIGPIRMNLEEGSFYDIWCCHRMALGWMGGLPGTGLEWLDAWTHHWTHSLLSLTHSLPLSDCTKIRHGCRFRQTNGVVSKVEKVGREIHSQVHSFPYRATTRKPNTAKSKFSRIHAISW